MSFLAIAHRAGNDLAQLRAAAKLGADVLELDVHAHRQRLEVRHDKSFGPLPYRWDRTSYGPIPLLTDSWALRRADPDQLLLAEVLDAARETGAALMLDLKGASRVGRDVREFVAARLPAEPVLVCARFWPSVTPFFAVPWARPVLSARNRVELARLRRRVLRPPVPYAVSVHRELLTPSVTQFLAGQVERVLTWPVNDVETLDDVLALGVGGVITDDLDVLRAAIARRG